MTSPGPSKSIPFKSKKRLFDPPSTKNPNSSSSSLPLHTPEKPLTRSSNQSIKEIRKAARSRRKSEDSLDKVSTARRQLVFSSNDSSSSDHEKLPEKYEALGRLFDAFDSSILLSRLRGSKPTFSNVSGKIERLTERRFCYSHLAQLKHILPEGIEIKRVLVHDEATCCMKPDLHVTLNADAVEEGEKLRSESKKKISLRRVFRERLAGFVKAHPQGDEVPEEQLPELFNRRKDSKVEVRRGSSVMEEMAFIPAAKLISSFVNVPPSPAEPQVNVAPKLSKVNLALTPANVLSTPAKMESTPVIVASTPPELASTPARLFSEAYLQKRSSGDTNSDDVPTDRPVKLARRSLLSSSKSLNFDSYTEDKKDMDVTDIDQVPEEDASSDDEILSILPDELRQSIKEQERKAMEESNPAISEAKRRRKMVACLPKLFNVIHYLIQSIRRWIITKEELVHKIIAGHSDITDRKEVEEQLMLMQELVPEWISEKRSSSGDLLVCINKLASPQTIRSQLEQENKKAVATSCP
ncbi:unnamed protein product [Eruca vesicaria subsp. sativa]|uniref:CDT1 Geminin-binding domain-containing protein n=1 Tax=Eruca vesicaria subsp. sativa TaxID=29727 RepID=A0ABC8IMH6_ERUVS|nr:unnamed protein product [Eruca vesicaria subsp. sativa]